jgi:hypothetical protein
LQWNIFGYQRKPKKKKESEKKKNSDLQCNKYWLPKKTEKAKNSPSVCHFRNRERGTLVGAESKNRIWHQSRDLRGMGASVSSGIFVGGNYAAGSVFPRSRKNRRERERERAQE